MLSDLITLIYEREAGSDREVCAIQSMDASGWCVAAQGAYTRILCLCGSRVDSLRLLNQTAYQLGFTSPTSVIDATSCGIVPSKSDLASQFNRDASPSNEYNTTPDSSLITFCALERSFGLSKIRDIFVQSQGISRKDAVIAANARNQTLERYHRIQFLAQRQINITQELRGATIEVWTLEGAAKFNNKSDTLKDELIENYQMIFLTYQKREPIWVKVLQSYTLCRHLLLLATMMLVPLLFMEVYRLCSN